MVKGIYRRRDSRADKQKDKYSISLKRKIENPFKLTSIAMRLTTDRHCRTDIVGQDWMHTYYIVVDISSLFCLFLRKGGSLCLYVHMFVCLSIRHSVGPARQMEEAEEEEEEG